MKVEAPEHQRLRLKQKDAEQQRLKIKEKASVVAEFDEADSNRLDVKVQTESFLEANCEDPTEPKQLSEQEIRQK